MGFSQTYTQPGLREFFSTEVETSYTVARFDYLELEFVEIIASLQTASLTEP